MRITLHTLSNGDNPFHLDNLNRTSTMAAVELNINRWISPFDEEQETKKNNSKDPHPLSLMDLTNLQYYSDSFLNQFHADPTLSKAIHLIPTYSSYHDSFADRTFFDLEIATCGMPKNSRLPIPQENYSLRHGSFGDDAGFTVVGVRKNFLGIADGAGGNLMYGYDPRLFSESLMRHCSELAHTGKYCSSDPKRLLCHAFDRLQNENSCFGSATACILGIDCRVGRLYSVNIGDSGYVIVRQGSVVYRSRSQAMNGDCPRQLDVYPWTASLKGHGLNYTQLSSSDAICQTFDLQLGDIVILSTDGLFDNVSDRLIEQILAHSRSLQHAAQLLVVRAVRFYLKPDDILVIMARVMENRSP